MTKLLLFDLDGTLLRTDKTISDRSLQALSRVREAGVLIGVVTSRSEQNCLDFLRMLVPDILISSAGALVKFGKEHVFKAEFTSDEVNRIIDLARRVDPKIEITVETLTEHFWNYTVDPLKWDPSWGGSTYTDYMDWKEPALKVCVQFFKEKDAEVFAENLPDVDMIRFTESYWYKLTKKGITKENAIRIACRKAGIPLSEVTAFGDDLADIGMLKLCGKGIAMGNAIDAVKEAADEVIGTNDADGIAIYLEGGLE